MSDRDPEAAESSTDLATQLVTLSAVIRAGQDAVASRATAVRIASAAGWTQREIADACDISQAAVSKILARARGGATVSHQTYRPREARAMSTNYYVRKSDGDEIHLGQFAARRFLFRAYPDRAVIDYDSWRAQFDLGEIRDEYDRVVTTEEMEQVASHRLPRLAPRYANEFADSEGRRFCTVEFC